MAILSMTGYGQFTAVHQDTRISVEMRTVNHRFAEFHIRLPREWLSLEDGIRRQLGASIRRGRVDVFVNLEGAATKQQVEVNWPLLDQLISAEIALCKRFERAFDADTVRDWLKYPDVVQIRTVEMDADDVRAALEMAVSEATEQLLRMRMQEGERLQANLQEKLQALRQQISFVEARDKVAVATRTAQLRARIQQLQVDVEDGRLAQEVVLLVDRTAVDEEVVRLASHIDAFAQALMQSGSVGRRLDFIVQEMNREVNTIGSKCADALIAKAVVEMKVYVEQLREQVQNVE